MKTTITCDGIARRDFLKVGALGTGLSLAGFLNISHAKAAQPGKAKSAIFIHLGGGPSHMDTFDLKPDAPSEYRGTFNPIKTNVSGIEISEHLPKLAACADKFAILRNVSHTLAAHELGTEYVSTGNRPLPSIDYPGYGSVVSKEFSTHLEKDLPPYVAVPDTKQRAGFLGVQYAPLSTASTPAVGKPFNVRGIALGGGLTLTEVERRQKLLTDLDQTFAAVEKDSQLLTGLDQFGEQAHAIITSKRAREAFDISKESADIIGRFGTDSFGQSCLLASRLVESGVRFVTLSMGGWDTHQNNFTQLSKKQCPNFDNGLAPLITTLADKGLLESTAILVTGEFGRTPKINNRAAEGGRDHYPRAMFMLMAGGGVKGGQVIGKTDDKGTQPDGDAISPDDVAATFYHLLGIDSTKEYHTNTGRPIMIVRDGKVVKSLVS